MDIEAIISGNRLALARLLTQVENDTAAGRATISALFPHTGRAHLIGVTGAPGTGKSSLVNRLAFYYRHPPAGQVPRRVAVVAVDPSSPFTGGAVLGDRVRMRDLSGDPGVFIRSMASRGSLGGLAQATAGIVQAFDAAGYEIILIETVGAGQAEVDVARLAHTTLVVEAPGLGDDIQAIKAGILEIADILVVNKADRPGVENTERALRGMLNLAHPVQKIFRHHGQQLSVDLPEPPVDQDIDLWLAPIQRTVATEGAGIAELCEQITLHRLHLEQSGDLHRRVRARLQAELDTLIANTLVSRWQTSPAAAQYPHLLEQLVARQISPWEAVQELIDGGTQ